MTAGGEDLLALGRQMLASLALCARSVRIYSTDNAVFLKQLQGLLEPLNRAVTLAGRLELSVRESALELNGTPVALDAAAQDALRALAQAFQAHGLSAVVAGGPVPLEDLRNFFALFVKDASEPPPEDGLAGHKLQALRVRRLALAAPAADAGAQSQEAARRAALTAYARTILWSDLHVKAVQERKPSEVLATCPRVCQDLVDANSRLRSSLLPLLVNGEGPRGLSHHLANTAVIAVTFAEKLGIARAQLRDLAVTALSAEAVLVHVPPELWMPADPDRLPPEHQQLRDQAFAEESQRALSSQPFRRLEQLRALSVGQMHESQQVPVRDAQGATAWQPRGDPLFVSRVLAMASHYDAMTSPSGERKAYGQDQALSALWGPLRYRFDADLLWVFLRLMARIPLKACPRHAGGIVDLQA